MRGRVAVPCRKRSGGGDSSEGRSLTLIGDTRAISFRGYARGQRGPRATVEQGRQLHGRGADRACAGSLQRLAGSIAPQNADCSNAVGSRSVHVVLAIAHHTGGRGVEAFDRQHVTDELRLGGSRTVQLAAVDSTE